MSIIDIDNGMWWAWRADGGPERDIFAEGIESWRRAFGSLVAYVTHEPQRDTARPYRWVIWHRGTLLGEGRTDTASGARSCAQVEADDVELKIANVIRAMDIRNARQG